MRRTRMRRRTRRKRMMGRRSRRRVLSGREVAAMTQYETKQTREMFLFVYMK